MTPFWTVAAVVAGVVVGGVALVVCVSLSYVLARVLVRAQLTTAIQRGLEASDKQPEPRSHKPDAGSGNPRPRVDAPAESQAHSGEWFDPFEPRRAAPEEDPAPHASIEERGELMAVIPAGSIGVEVRKVRVEDLTPEEKAEIDAQTDREMEVAAKQAVADTGLTGPDADRLFQGIMEGIARAKASGKSHGTIAIAMNPGTLDPVGVKLGPPMADGLAHPGRRVAIRSQAFDFTNDGKPVS